MISPVPKRAIITYSPGAVECSRTLTTVLTFKSFDEVRAGHELHSLLLSPEADLFGEQAEACGLWTPLRSSENPLIHDELFQTMDQHLSDSS